MSLEIYPSRIGEAFTLKVSYENELGEITEATVALSVNAPNLRSTENNGEHLFLMAADNVLLCSSDRGDFT